MAQALNVIVEDKSTIMITAAFKDEDDASVIPLTIVWSLTDGDGIIINSRDQVNVGTPAASITIVLSGDDLDHSEGSSRSISIEATYNSSLGNGLPLNAQADFKISNIRSIR